LTKHELQSSISGTGSVCLERAKWWRWHREWNDM